MEQWEMVDEGWGRLAADFATLSEPGNVREYLAMHQLLGIGDDDRLLDLACGAGLALELAGLRGARCSGIDASPRLLDVARHRSPAADLRVGDMNALPWPDDSFDVVTSFRGVWATTPNALREAVRVLRPGGRFGLTAWGHLKASAGYWALLPFRLASEPDVANQADMNQIGKPGVGERLLEEAGFVDIERVEIPFAWEFADPEHFARAMASTGPAFEAIKQVGEQAFYEQAIAVAHDQVRAGLPLRAEIKVAGFIARAPERHVPPLSYDGEATGNFLGWYPPSAGSEKLRAEDIEEDGFVWNVSRLWGRAPESVDRLFDLMRDAVRLGGLSMRQRGVLVTAAASTLGDSYCSFAWGGKLANEASADLAGGVLDGTDTGLDASEQALAVWARKVARDPNATTAADVEQLRAAGFSDDQIFAATYFVALRLAFSTVNDALGASPDVRMVEALPAAVRQAVDWGRPPA